MSFLKISKPRQIEQNRHGWIPQTTRGKIRFLELGEPLKFERGIMSPDCPGPQYLRIHNTGHISGLYTREDKII